MFMEAATEDGHWPDVLFYSVSFVNPEVLHLVGFGTSVLGKVYVCCVPVDYGLLLPPVQNSWDILYWSHLCSCLLKRSRLETSPTRYIYFFLHWARV